MTIGYPRPPSRALRTLSPRGWTVILAIWVAVAVVIGIAKIGDIIAWWLS